MDKVLIGIPTLNGPERLERLLTSIKTHTTMAPEINILVADDGSLDENLKLNKDVVTRHCVEMLMSERTGIAATWNRIVRHDRGQHDIIVLINDDIEVVEHWLDVIVYSLKNNKHIGMLGLNSYCGVTHGQLEVINSTPLRIDYHEANLLDGGGTLLSSHGPIFAFRKEVYEQVGGFDERYFVFYEELDFGVACRRAGYVNYMSSYPIVYHMGGATNSDPVNLDAQQHIHTSRIKFNNKWKLTLDQLRNEFVAKYMTEYKDIILKQWNTQIYNWKV